MGKDTKILSSHSTDGVLKKYYLDTKVLSVLEKGALEIKIFAKCLKGINEKQAFIYTFFGYCLMVLNYDL